MTGQCIDWQRSQELADLIEAEMKACWSNASLALLRAGAVGQRDLVYCEGWIVLGGVPIPTEHGWLQTDSGVIVDPTLVLVPGERDEPATYFAGVKYTFDDVYRSLINQRATPPFVWEHGWGGCESPEYMAARDQAYRHAYGWTPEEITRQVQRTRDDLSKIGTGHS
jgi:hypothetical protein